MTTLYGSRGCRGYHNNNNNNSVSGAFFVYQLVVEETVAAQRRVFQVLCLVGGTVAAGGLLWCAISGERWEMWWGLEGWLLRRLAGLVDSHFAYFR